MLILSQHRYVELWLPFLGLLTKGYTEKFISQTEFTNLPRCLDLLKCYDLYIH